LVRAPAEIVFALFADIPQAANNVRGIARIEMLTGSQVGVGTRFRETRILFKRESTEELEIVSFVPGESYALACSSLGCPYTMTFRFAAEGEGTSVRLDTEFPTDGIKEKLTAPLVALMSEKIKDCAIQDMDDLQQLAESQSASVENEPDL
jgi:hypothetical protein